MKLKLFLIPHTHWDREWHHTFQQFRFRLARLMDKLLGILASDPDYRRFTLDGQAIVVEDYLEIYPEREAELRRYIQEGRLLIGPWYVLPDEFLVSPEAIIRNLMFGDQICRRFGFKMDVGYTPDTFGHIGQLPQILKGFGIEVAVLRRGLSDEPVELTWEAPDGSRILLLYLRDGYDNAARLPLHDEDELAQALQRIAESLAPHSLSGCIHLMHGTDHMEPDPRLTAALKKARERLQFEAELLIADLPSYVRAVKEALAEKGHELPVVRGELRSPKRHHLLSGVLSTRIWLKQRNAHCQVLLEKWAEPFAAFAHFTSPRPLTPDPRPFIRESWRHLLRNHPHDSICGCSIDQVDKEVALRFDWVEQIAEGVISQSLEAIANQVASEGLQAVVFNPTAGPRTDVATATVPLRGDLTDFILVDEEGEEVPHQVVTQRRSEIASLELDRDGFMGMMSLVQEGRILNYVLQGFHISVQGDVASIDLTLAEHGPPDKSLAEEALWQARALVSDKSIRHFHIKAHTPTEATFVFLAPEVPGHGYRTFRLLPSPAKAPPSGQPTPMPLCIENQSLIVKADPSYGTFTLTDRETGLVLRGLNHFVDGGDRGDEYNYCPPEEDLIVDHPAYPPVIEVAESGPVRQTLRIEMVYLLPASLSDDRKRREVNTVEVPVISYVSLYPGIRRLDIRTEVWNRARDHRLRVHFPVPVQVEHAWVEGAFEVIRRPVEVPAATAEWVEQPQPTGPNLGFVDVNDGQKGLMVANRGLPEYEVIRKRDGMEIALTLLRSVGWLSRDDLSTRRGHAGPALPTPGAQGLGKHVFEYAIIPHRGGWQVAFQEAQAFRAPFRALVTDAHPGPLPSQMSFVQVEPQALVVSAIKLAAKGEGLLVRLYNPTDERVRGRIRLWRPFHKASLANLNEEEIEELPLKEGREVAIAVRPKGVVTLCFQGPA